MVLSSLKGTESVEICPLPSSRILPLDRRSWRC